MSAPGLLLIWNDTTPVFQELTPVAGEWLLGRNHPAWSPRDEHMSRDHCRIAHTGSEWQLEDLGSANGSRLDGKPFAGSLRCATWSVLQLGHSLVIPYRQPLVRSDICHEGAFASADWDTLERAARTTPPGDWEPEIVWWVHHALRILGPFQLELAYISAYLIMPWRERLQLLHHARTTAQWLRDGAHDIMREHFHFWGSPALDYIVRHAVEIPIPRHDPRAARLSRLRDPEVIVQALTDASGDHQRAAEALEISVDALGQWIRRHRLQP